MHIQAPFLHALAPVPSFVPTSYSVVPHIFAHQNASSAHANMGLLLPSWPALVSHLNQLNRDADDLTAYRLIYAQRHGQGYHNVAVDKYGEKMWDCYWSTLDGDGEIQWADPELTELGKAQASHMHNIWRHQLQQGMPKPQSVYVSPLRRAMSTFNITFSDLRVPRPLVVENLREMIGLHTCDRRSDKTTLQSRFPTFAFESAFSEQDQLWTRDYQETAPQQSLRMQQLFNRIFSTDGSPSIAIVSHSGAMNAFFTVFGHPHVDLPPGVTIPFVLKMSGHPETGSIKIVGGQSATLPACSAV